MASPVLCSVCTQVLPVTNFATFATLNFATFALQTARVRKRFRRTRYYALSCKCNSQSQRIANENSVLLQTEIGMQTTRHLQMHGGACGSRESAGRIPIRA